MSQHTRTGERRRTARVSAAYTVSICDQRWRILARGRTSNVSENGASIVADAQRGVPQSGIVHVEFTLPVEPAGRGPRRQMRIVRYVARVARVQQLGNLLGLGVEFIEKLG